MKYMRKTAGCNWAEYKTITEITKELDISFGQNTGIHKKLVATYKQITEDDKNLKTKRQKEVGDTTEETSGSVSPEQVYKCPNFMLL